MSIPLSRTPRDDPGAICGPPLPTLHHVGIVQPTMAAAEAYMKLFGHEEDYRGEVPEFECWCLFCKAPAGQPAVELVGPTGGPLARFNHGIGGLHHYALLTEDIRALQAELAARDIPMLRQEPVRGRGHSSATSSAPSRPAA